MYVRDAFKVILVNRNNLTKYYEKLPVACEVTTASTQRHKHFNQTLAQAYRIFFPCSKAADSRNDNRKHKSTEKKPLVFTNTFELLSAIIEEEPAFEKTASEFWQLEQLETDKSHSIANHSVMDALTGHLFVTELQHYIVAIKSLWTSAANAKLPMAVAGWLTNTAQTYLRSW